MSALDELGEAAMKVVVGLATKHQVDLEPEVLVKLAGQLLTNGLELVTQGAKKKAAAAGDAAADAITTEDEAEAAQRKP